MLEKIYKQNIPHPYRLRLLLVWALNGGCYLVAILGIGFLWSAELKGWPKDMSLLAVGWEWVCGFFALLLLIGVFINGHTWRVVSNDAPSIVVIKQLTTIRQRMLLTIMAVFILIPALFLGDLSHSYLSKFDPIVTNQYAGVTTQAVVVQDIHCTWNGGKETNCYIEMLFGEKQYVIKSHSMTPFLLSVKVGDTVCLHRLDTPLKLARARLIRPYIECFWGDNSSLALDGSGLRVSCKAFLLTLRAVRNGGYRSWMRPIPHYAQVYTGLNLLY